MNHLNHYHQQQQQVSQIIGNVQTTSIKSFGVNSCPVIGHFPCSSIYFKIKLFSNKCPVFLETTG